MSSTEILLKLSIWLYHRKRLSLGQARKLAGLNVLEFQQALTNRDLYLNYDLEDWQNDLRVASLL